MAEHRQGGAKAGIRITFVQLLDKCTILCMLEVRIESVGASQITEPDFQLPYSLTLYIVPQQEGTPAITLRLLSLCDFPRSLLSFRLLPQKAVYQQTHALLCLSFALSFA